MDSFGGDATEGWPVPFRAPDAESPSLGGSSAALAPLRSGGTPRLSRARLLAQRNKARSCVAVARLNRVNGGCVIRLDVDQIHRDAEIPEDHGLTEGEFDDRPVDKLGDRDGRDRPPFSRGPDLRRQRIRTLGQRQNCRGECSQTCHPNLVSSPVDP